MVRKLHAARGNRSKILHIFGEAPVGLLYISARFACKLTTDLSDFTDHWGRTPCGILVLGVP